MIVEWHLFLLGTILLVGPAILVATSSRFAGRRFDGQSLFGEDELGFGKWDAFSAELGERIFSSSDFDFFNAEASSEYRRRFREERVALALNWLVQLRCEVDRAMRIHVKAARLSPNLRPVDELKLAGEYCFFQLSNRFLYCAVWAFGPLAAAHLVAHSLRLSSELKHLTEMLPSARSAVAELVQDEPQRGSVAT